VRYPRGARVVLRTGRGLELGEILAPLADDSAAPREGSILRAMTEQDQLLETRLTKNRGEAYDACRRKLAERGLDAALVDVEHLFDGRSLVFYFLGEQPPELGSITDELAEAYDAQVQFRAFTDAVAQGCGPDCGTEHAAGCGSCGTGCAIAAACSSHKH
jgi:cell fate regulator YaaT (PSP1 superfamily)